MKFVDQMDFLDRMIICRICGSEESRRDCRNRFIWVTDKDRHGNWTHQYICYNCAYLNNRYCHICGREEKLMFHYDNDGYWDGRRICYFCIVKIRK
jgi:hypothetical protein